VDKNGLKLNKLVQKKQVIEKEEEICPICCCEIEKKAKNVMKLPCKHKFHKDCIKKWHARKKVCPVCRATLKNKI